MWYNKNLNTGEWYAGNTIYLPTGEILKDNHNETIGGWVWYDEPPQEYIDWFDQQQNLIQ